LLCGLPKKHQPKQVFLMASIVASYKKVLMLYIISHIRLDVN